MKQAIENILIERLQTSIEGISSILTNKFSMSLIPSLSSILSPK